MAVDLTQMSVLPKNFTIIPTFVTEWTFPGTPLEALLDVLLDHAEQLLVNGTRQSVVDEDVGALLFWSKCLDGAASK